MASERSQAINSVKKLIDYIIAQDRIKTIHIDIPEVGTLDLELFEIIPTIEEKKNSYVNDDY